MPQTVTSRTFFETMLPALVANRKDRAALPELVATFQLVGNDGGTWTLRCNQGHGEGTKCDAQDARLRFIVADRQAKEAAVDEQLAYLKRKMKHDR